MYALYARQSIEKKDSISIENQLDLCKYETRGQPFKEYKDIGYSGKNMDRPAFELMMKDIGLGAISKVVVYKLDRISRSILDFSNLMEVFQKFNVEFISTTEKFDTSTPIGRAMLHICIVFAQLERETIQKRVADAYYSRCRKGFYMGGRVPYGFSTEHMVIDGVKTSRYIPIPEEREHIRLLYSLYSDTQNSLGDVVKHLNLRGIKNRRGSAWSTARISEILRNPVYVKADADVYEFFQSAGVNIINPAADFIGSYACYLYKGVSPLPRRRNELTGRDLVLAPHEGLVSSCDWLACRRRCKNNQGFGRAGKACNSWLSGKIKCGMCGYALIIRKADTKWRRYFVCSGKANNPKCGGAGTIYADVLEDYMDKAIHKRLSEFGALSPTRELRANPALNESKIRILEIEREIDDLLSKVAGANDVLMGYINDRISELDKRRGSLKEGIQSIERESNGKSAEKITNHADVWEGISFEDRQAALSAFVNVISVADGRIIIEWKI